jgi:SagB-type dehydrogenase family enzyme
MSGNDRLAMFVPTTERTLFDPKLRFGPGVHILSRFAYMRREENHLLLESPLTGSQVLLHHQSAMAMVSAFVNPVSAADVGSSGDAEAVLTILANSGAIVECDEAGREQEPAGSSQWEFHDLLFHARSRLGRHANPYGGRIAQPFAFESFEEPLEGIELYAPDIEKLKREDPPFAQVVETRRSVRTGGDAAITAKQLGEFLYRSARVRGEGNRPHPSAGGCYELELYVAVQRCAGLDAGLYHYRPRSHRLEKIAEPNDDVASLLAQARIATGGAAAPQILIAYAARMERLTAKYQGLAYALALKDAGVLQQTMCLTAAAMGLAGCPLGGGDSDAFARASGRDYYRETSVGEFILASLPEARK